MIGKVWGTTECLLTLPGFEVHRIHAKKGGYCSKHKHQYKHNLFYVESGVLEIVVFQLNGFEDHTILRTGEKASVPPNLPHRFTALEGTVAYEIYWAETDIADDIVREDVGGVRE